MNNKILTFISLAIILVIIGFGIFTQRSNDTAGTDLVEYEDTALILDTINRVRVYAVDEEEGRKAVDQVFKRLEEIEAKLDIYKADSEISEINKNAGENMVEVSEGTFNLLKEAVKYAEETDGDFDPTIGALTLLWGWGDEEGPSVPPQEDIEDTLDLVNYEKISFAEENLAVGLEKEGMQLDLGAIAKGYASIESYNVLGENGIQRAFINLGGNITLKGMKPDQSPWRIGIQHPRSARGEVMAAVSIDEDEIETSRAVVTSGDYERYFEEDGEEYHHIIDPFTGYPTTHEIISASIITDDPVKADAYSTGILVKGLEGRELIENTENMEALFISADQEVYATTGIRDSLEIFDDDFSLVDWDEITD